MQETTIHFPELGARLRAAREAQKLSSIDLAQRIRVSPNVLRSIELGEFDRLGPMVYRRGYLSAYARAVGVPLAELDDALFAPVAPIAQPVSSNLIPPRSNPLDRYASAASYLVGTAVVVVSLVWSLQQARVTGARSVPVSVPVIAIPSTPEPLRAPGVTPPLSTTASSSANSDPSFSPGPVIASLTPMFNSANAPAPVSELALKFSEETWVEIRRESDGKRLEYNSMAGGTQKSYSLEGGIRVVIGNARGVSATVASLPFDLTPLTRGNVATFELPAKR